MGPLLPTIPRGVLFWKDNLKIFPFFSSFRLAQPLNRMMNTLIENIRFNICSAYGFFVYIFFRIEFIEMMKKKGVLRVSEERQGTILWIPFLNRFIFTLFLWKNMIAKLLKSGDGSSDISKCLLFQHKYIYFKARTLKISLWHTFIYLKMWTKITPIKYDFIFKKWL